MLFKVTRCNLKFIEGSLSTIVLISFFLIFQVSRWESDIYKYLEEDESELSYSIRLLAFDLLVVRN